MAQELSLRTLGELARLLDADLQGPVDLPIVRPVPAGDDDPTGIAFAEDEPYVERALTSAVGAVILPREHPPVDKPSLRVDDPRAAFGRLLALAARDLALPVGVHPSAVIDPSAEIDATAAVGACAVVAEDAVIGPSARIGPLTYVGPRCRIGAECVIYPHAVLVQDVTLGRRSIVHAGAVIGSDGFGFVPVQGKRLKVPQAGGVSIGDDVEIGANTCIDRATCGDTKIGDGSKIDNLVQVAHNVAIGRDAVLAGQVGLSGSVRIGDRVVLGGQVGISHQVEVGADVSLGGQSGVLQDLTEPGEYLGVPAMPLRDALRGMAVARRLPELLKRITDLEREVDRLMGGR